MAIKPTILLHSCCGPCSTSVIEKLIDVYNITVFFYNPNISDDEEYEKRKSTQIFFLDSYNQKIQSEISDAQTVGLIEGDYNPIEFTDQIESFGNEPEGGKRCDLCFDLRLTATAAYARESNFDFFGTTLSVSPHKNAESINSIGLKLAAQYDVRYLISDFKKQDGYGRSVQLAKDYHLYRQNYCGCKYSIPNKGIGGQRHDR